MSKRVHFNNKLNETKYMTHYKDIKKSKCYCPLTICVCLQLQRGHKIKECECLHPARDPKRYDYLAARKKEDKVRERYGLPSAPYPTTVDYDITCNKPTQNYIIRRGFG